MWVRHLQHCTRRESILEKRVYDDNSGDNDNYDDSDDNVESCRHYVSANELKSRHRVDIVNRRYGDDAADIVDDN